jgi:predicted GIY-YIG superfamily endonuclease
MSAWSIPIDEVNRHLIEHGIEPVAVDMTRREAFAGLRQLTGLNQRALNEVLVSAGRKPHEPTTLYRLFDDDMRLLYVGIAGNPGRRFEQHAIDKPWWGEVAFVRTRHFETRSDALDAERQAIQEENPRHNVVHRVQP